MPARNFNATMVDYVNNKPLQQPVYDDNNKEVIGFIPYTFKTATLLALYTMQDDDKNLTIEKKHELFRIARKVGDAKKPLDLKTTEIAIIKARALKVLPPMVGGQVAEMLET